MIIYFHIIYGFFLATTAELSSCDSCDRDYMAHSIEDIFTIWPFTEKVCQPLTD